MADTMETEMDLSDGEQKKANAHVTLSQYSAPPLYNNTGLFAVYGNSSFGVEESIERRHNPELPGYIFMCNGRTKVECFRYRVFGVPRERIHIVESLKPGMKIFLFDFEKNLLYGVYEVTIGGKLDIEPEAFERNLPAQVGFRIFKNCYPLPENTFKSVILENFNGAKFKQELAPHQVTSLLSLFRSFPAPELDSLAQRLASRASAPGTISFEERFIAATQLRNASSGLDPLSARHENPQLGSLLAHRSVPHTSLLQHSYSRPANYIAPPSLSNLNQPYYPTEIQQQRLPGDTSRSTIQDPQLKYLTILSDIRRYGATSGNEYHSEKPPEKDQFTSPYSASAANGSVYTPASQKEGEASQQQKIPSETAGYPTLAQSEAVGNDPKPAANGNTHQPQSVAVNHTTQSQPGSVEESAQAYASYTHQQYYAAMGYTTQQYTGATGYIQQPHEIGYAQQPHAAPNGYAQQPHEVAYAQQLATGYAQQPHAAATGYTQQPYAATTVYAQQPYGAATEYALQQPHAQAVGYTQQAVTQGSTPGAPGTTEWNAAYQYYYPQTSEATTTYNQTS